MAYLNFAVQRFNKYCGSGEYSQPLNSRKVIYSNSTEGFRLYLDAAGDLDIGERLHRIQHAEMIG